MNNKKKKIFFWGELPPKTIHGASISNQINVNILKKKFEVDIVEEYSNLKYHGKFSLSKTKQFLSTVILTWSMFFKNTSKYSFYYGIVYLSTFGAIKNLLVISMFKILNKEAKVILHFHRSDFELFHRSSVNRVLFNLLDSLVEKYIVLAQKQFIDFRKHTLKKVCVLYNTIDEYLLVKENIIKESNSKIKLLFISNFIIEKGFLDLIEAQKKLNSLYPGLFELNCFGSFANSNEKNGILSFDLSEHNIIINEKIYGDQKNEMMNSVDMIILPSYNEGLPLVLLEALHLGKPIIISNVGYVSEILGEDYPLYCKPKNVESIVKCILDFRSKYNTIEFSRWLEIKYENFSYEKHEQELLLIFDK